MAQSTYGGRLSEEPVRKLRGDPQLIPVQRAVLGAGLAAGSAEGQQKFLQIFGLLKTNIPIQDSNVLEPDVAELVATGLNHTIKGGVREGSLFDPYYTPEEWELRHQLVERHLAEVCRSGNLVSPTQVTSYKEALGSACHCVAHCAALEWVWKLIDIPEPLTDDWGSKLVQVVLPLILKSAGLDAMDVEGCGQGSPYAVNFILQLPSGESQQLTGWPDFTVTQRYTSFAEQRILRSHRVRRSQRLHGVGEIQSQPTKTATIAQAGMYGVGQLAKRGTTRMAVIILYKDKSAQVAVATMRQPVDPSTLYENSLGEVDYSMVESLDALSLKVAEDLQHFARIFVSTIKWAMQE